MISKKEYSKNHGRIINFSHNIIILSIKFLSIITVFTIVIATLNSLWILYSSLIENNFILKNIDFLNIFSQILIVLIAVEIFQNIAVYIKTDTIPIKLVLATALIAVARKFIIIDINKDNLWYIFALAVAVISLSLSYYLIDRNNKLKSK